MAVGFVIMLTMILAMCLLAIDVARLRLAQAQLHNALDAAALAGTRDVHSATLEADVRKVFDANFDSTGRIAELTAFRVRPISDARGIRRLHLTAEARLASPLGALLDEAGLDWLRVTAENETLRSTRGLELVMALDVTGSMRQENRMEDLRSAAHALTDVLFDGEETQPHLWVGIVPYNSTVNIGARHSHWLKAQPTAGDFAPTTWKGCVLARGSGRDRTDATPMAERFDLFRWPSMDDPKMHFQGYERNNPPLNIWPQHGRVDERNSAENDGYGPNLSCGPTILPLSASASAVRAKLDELQPWHRGGTMANIGLVWGWRVLSPDWDGLWRDAANKPISILPYETPYMSKVIVLMTDGINYWFRQDYTAYRYPQDNLLGGATIDERMLSACELLKSKGIVVYTITFGSGVNEATKALYGHCASAPNQSVHLPGQKYFHAPTGNILSEAFDSIGEQLTELRLTQ